MRRTILRPWFHLDTRPAAVQRIVPPSTLERFEGVGFSPSGNILAVATSESNSVLLFRRNRDGRFNNAPYQIIGKSLLHYPHDVSFSMWNDGGLLAVAQRAGAIAIYAKNGSNGDYTPVPIVEISGPESKLAFSDGVVFVPPRDHYLAACNLEFGTISFFRRATFSPPVFANTPEFELRHDNIYHPDGLDFSSCGKWLAVANHGQQSVAIFRRRHRSLIGNDIGFDPEPVTIKDPHLRYPHSVAFTPRTNHLVVTNAGANYFSVYAPDRQWLRMVWSEVPRSQVTVHDDEARFKEVNMNNKMEGGPKGIAINGNMLAVCSPQIGIKIYSFREGWR